MAAPVIAQLGFRPFVLQVANQQQIYCGAGLCDPYLQSSASAISPLRYDTGLFVVTLAANGGNLILPSGQSFDLFVGGIGTTIANGWWTKTLSDTDLPEKKGGAPVSRNFVFLIMGIAVEVPDCFQREGTAGASNDGRQDSAWLNKAHDGAGYSFALAKAVMNYTAVVLSAGDTGCSQRVGLLAHSPHWGQPAGPQAERLGLTAMPGTYLPFTTAYCAGSEDDLMQMTMTLTFGQRYVVENNAGAGQTLCVDVDETNCDVYQPVRISIIGYILCAPAAALCGVPGLTAEGVVVAAQRGIVPG